MTEKVQEQDQPKVDQVQEETESKDATIDVQEMIKKEVAAYQEQSKKEIAGLNRRNEELRKELQQKELDKLSEEDRLKKETEILRQEKELILKETQTLNRARIVDKALFDAGLPQDFAKRINGDDSDTILEDIKNFQDFINAEAERRATAITNKRLGGEAPETGTVPDDGYQAQYTAAFIKGDMTTCVNIKRRAAAEGVTIQ